MKIERKKNRKRNNTLSMHRRRKKWLLHFYIFGYKTTTATTSITMYEHKKIALC